MNNVERKEFNNKLEKVILETKILLNNTEKKSKIIEKSLDKIKDYLKSIETNGSDTSIKEQPSAENIGIQ